MLNQQTAFQYSILHYRHDLVTGEFLNVGLAMYCPDPAFLNVRILTKYRRVSRTFPGVDGDFFRKYMDHLQLLFDVKAREINSGQMPLIKYPQALEELLNTVLPHDDSSVFFGSVKYGMTPDVERTFEGLYARMIEYYVSEQEKSTRNDDEVWNVYRQSLVDRKIISKLSSHVVRTQYDELQFDHTWQNGRWNILQPLSFDLSVPTNIRKKAREWRGAIRSLDESGQLASLYLLLGRPVDDQSECMKVYQESKMMLTETPKSFKLEIIEENQAEEFGREISQQIEIDLKSHSNE